MNFILHWLGLDNSSGPIYSFYSGVGSDIAELSLLGGVIGILRKHNCETHGCPRLGRHEWIDPLTGLRHVLCRKHHPHDHLTQEYILQTKELNDEDRPAEVKR